MDMCILVVLYVLLLVSAAYQTAIKFVEQKYALHSFE